VTLNRRAHRFATLALTLLLSACATTEPPQAQPVSDAPVIAQESKGPQPQMKFKLASGIYRCELGQKVEIQRDAKDANLIKLNWKGKRLTLQRHDSTSGLPRYEDRQNGLLWIDLPWKSVLMDARTGHPLANECKANS